MYYPALLYLDEGFLGGIRGDPAAYIYYVIHNINRVITWPSAGYDGNYFFPFGNSLAFSDNFILPALLAAPIYWISKNYSLAYNTVLAMAPITGGYLTFCLARYITKQTLVSFFSGLSFMCLPFLYAHLGHPQLQFTFGLPAMILVCLWFAETRKVLPATLIGFIVFIQFFATVYYSLITYLLAFLVLAGYALLRFRTLTYRDFCLLLCANIPWILLVFFTTTPYMAVRNAFLPWPPELIRRLSATFYSYFSASNHHLLWGRLTAHLGYNGSWLFLGITVLLLAAASIILLIFYRKIDGIKDEQYNKTKTILSFLIALSICVLVFTNFFIHDSLSLTAKARLISIPLWICLMSLLAFLFLRGLECKDQKLQPLDFGYLFTFIACFFVFASLGIISSSGDIELYHFMHNYLPGYNGLRAAYRFGIIAGLAFIMLATFALRKQKNWLIVVAILLVMTEYKTRPYKPSVDKPIPNIYRRLANIPGNEAVISLPFDNPLIGGTYSRRHTAYMLWTAPTLRPMMSGWSSKIPLYYQFKGKQIDQFPNQTSLNTLGQIIGLKYLIFNRRFVSDFKKKEFIKNLEQAGSQIKLLHMSKDYTSLFSLQPEVILNDLKYPEIYAIPNQKNERILAFEIKTLRSFQLQAVSDKNFTYKQDLIGTDKWQKIEFKIPSSTDPIKPQKIKFNGLPASKVLLRKPQLTDVK